MTPDPLRRLRTCVEQWPDAQTGSYDPRCCRFPKSCSATVYDAERVAEGDLEPVTTAVTTERYVTGNRNGRTIYQVQPDGSEVCVGLLDSPGLARLFVVAVNDWLARTDDVGLASGSGPAVARTGCTCPDLDVRSIAEVARGEHRTVKGYDAGCLEHGAGSG